jgi:hypothetical protein
MRRPLLAPLLAAAGGAVLWSLAVWAQVTDATPCSTACYEQKEACVTVCGSHDDPVECEASCHEQLQECLERCG